MNGGRIAAPADREMITDIWTLVGGGKLTSVLICDDRPSVLQAMSDLLRPLPGLNQILCVTEGFELLDTCTSNEADLVLIGIHHASTTGAEAASLLLALHPTAVVVVFGPVTESGTLAAAYTHGARGLLLWDPDQPSAGGPIT